MSTTINEGIDAEVQQFLAAVREQLADLDADEQREILDGLEADLTDLVAEHGGGALGDPVAYARELRAAAGLDPEPEAVRRRMTLSQGVHTFLDDVHDKWDLLVAALPGDGQGMLDTLRPMWWIVRAWAAVELADLLFGRGHRSGSLIVVPDLRGFGWLVLVIAVFLSVQMGRDKLWPGRGGDGLAPRVLLLGLNVFAVVMAPLVVAQLGPEWDEGAYGRGYADGSKQAQALSKGVSLDGEPVRNIYPYDAQGHALTGVQLFDSSGHPLTLTNDPYREGAGWGDFLLVPWLNGKTEQYNVFPLAEQRVDPQTQEPVGAPALQQPPFASVPPVALDGVTPSLIQGPPS